MRVLGMSVLIFEAIVVGLAIPVALTLGGTSNPGLVAVAFGAVALVCLVVSGLVTRSWGVAAGWVVQVLVLATAVVVPAMAIMAIVFGALWWAAVHYGRKADAIRSAAPNP